MSLFANLYILPYFPKAKYADKNGKQLLKHMRKEIQTSTGSNDLLLKAHLRLFAIMLKLSSSLYKPNKAYKAGQKAFIGNISADRAFMQYIKDVYCTKKAVMLYEWTDSLYSTLCNMVSDVELLGRYKAMYELVYGYESRNIDFYFRQGYANNNSF